ncbi:MAG: hypothetical protein L3J44_07225 [Campylobacteraceae bacterium]|nr:hypothetical protein [Campylobacteraceae bacterium]
MDKEPTKRDIFKANLLKQLKPKTSWGSFVGIFIFFFMPEIIAFFWGDRIISYSNFMQQHTDVYLMQKMYGYLKMFGENSLFNIILGLGLTGWFFYEKRKR